MIFLGGAPLSRCHAGGVNWIGMGRHWLTPLCSFVGVAQLLHTKQWQTMFVLGLLHVLDLVHAQTRPKPHIYTHK